MSIDEQPFLRNKTIHSIWIEIEKEEMKRFVIDNGISRIVEFDIIKKASNFLEAFF